MIDKEDMANIARIIGVILSLASVALMISSPFENVVNTLIVYFMLIASALFVMVGQIITIRLNLPGEFSNDTKRHEALYDVITVGVVIVLFTIFYAIPYLSKYAS